MFQLRFFCFGIVVFPGKLWCFTAWLVNINNSGATVFHTLATKKSCGNIYFSDQHYQPGKTTSEVSVPMIEYLAVVSFELWMVWYMYIFGFNYCCSRNCDREKSYASVVKGVCWFWDERFSNYRVLKTEFRKYLDH